MAGHIPFRQAWLFAMRLTTRFSKTNCSLLASGIAFYGLLSIIPGFAVLISAFGLFADPKMVEHFIDDARGVFPDEALDLLSQQLDGILRKQNAQLGIGLIAGLALTLWSARSAASAVMSALNMVYQRTDERSVVIQQIVALGLTVGGIMATIIGLVTVAIVPAVLEILPIDLKPMEILSLLRWPFISAVIIAVFSLVYRYAPCRAFTTQWKVILASTGGAFLWIAGSGLFSFYVSRFGSYDRVYGSLGAVIVLLMWFYVSALALLIGAVIDAELEAGR